MSSQHYALNSVRGDVTEYGSTTGWYIDDGILHVTHTDSDDDTTQLHFRLVQIEQQWVEVTS